MSTAAARLSWKVVFIWLSISSGLNVGWEIGGLGVAAGRVGCSGGLGTGVGGGGCTDGGVGGGGC